MRRDIGCGDRGCRVVWDRLQVNGNATVRRKTQFDVKRVGVITLCIDVEDVIGAAELTKIKLTRIIGDGLLDQVATSVTQANGRVLDCSLGFLGINRTGQTNRLAITPA